MKTDSQPMGSFEKSTLYRLLVEVVRYWVIETFLRTEELPGRGVWFVYAAGPEGLDWGDSPGPNDGFKPLRGKRIRVTVEIENHP